MARDQGAGAVYGTDAATGRTATTLPPQRERRREVTAWLATARAGRLATQQGLLAGVVASAAGLIVPFAYWIGGAGAATAAGAAGVVCLACAAVALALRRCMPGPERALQSMLFAMAARTGGPLLFAALVHLHGGLLDRSGIVYYLLTFYAVTMVAETALVLPATTTDPPPRSPHDAA